MISYYGLENKPSFEDGQKVDVDFNKLGMPEVGIVRGEVVGKAISHLLDFWIIKFDRNFGTTYPYKVISIPHTCIVMGFEYK